MGLYLAIFEDENEVDGVEVGAYDDFGAFRDAVVEKLEAGKAGSKFPTLILHSDCDGHWSPSEAAKLEKELEQIAQGFRRLSPVPLGSGWKRKVAQSFGLRIESLYDCFFDVDGEPLVERLVGLTKLSQRRNLPILFQ